MVAFTKMHHERKVVERLRAKGIECFAPVTHELRQWSDRKKLAERLVVSMMVFTYVTEDERIEVLHDPSVSYYMKDRLLRQLAVIPDEQVQLFQRFLKDSEGPVTVNPNLLCQGESVQVTDGPLAGVTGRFSKYKGKGLLSINIDVLGTATVEILAEQVRLLNEDEACVQ